MLQHELAIRGLECDNSKTVDSMRSALRPLLAMEKRSTTVCHPPYVLDIGDELAKVKEHLDIAKADVQALTPESDESKYLSLQSRLIHLFNRVNRIPLSSSSEEQAPVRSAFLSEILSFLDHLGVVFETSLGQDRDQDPSRSRSSSVSSRRSDVVTNVVPPQGIRSPQHASTFRNPVSPSRRSTSYGVEKWNLKFSGDQRSLSVHNFLERVAELCVARNVTETQLFSSAIDLFSGRALNWFRANKGRFNDWTSLSDLLRRHFEPPDYRSRLFREILERTQDPTEPIVDYLSSMQGLFRRHGGLPPDTQLDILSRNLAPFYLTQLPIVRTIEELETECLKLEARKFRVDHYIPPSRKRQSFVEPGFAYISQQVDSASSVPVPPVVDEVGPSPARITGSRVIKCWNCGQEGHFNRQCRNPQRLHCFKCGAPGVTSRSCTKCSSSENGPRRNQ